MNKISIISMMIVVMATFLATGAYADFAIDSDFDSGSIGSYTIDNDANEIEFTAVSDGLSYTYWTNFKVSEVLGEEVTFRITNANQAPFLIGLNDDNDPEEAQMVYSCDGENWDRLTNHSYSAGIYTFTETFSCDEVQIATFFPFSYEKMSDFVDTVSASQWAEKDFFLGLSEQGRDINLLIITNTAIPIEDKKIIYIIGRQHAAETTSSYMLEGMINFLISDDINTCGLRNNFVWYIVPMVNPDGVYVGNSRATAEGVDPNRDWHPDNHDSVEIDRVRSNIVSINTDYGIDFFIDWHSQMYDDKWYNFLYSPTDNTFFSILSDWTNFDSQSTPDAPGCSSTYCTCRGYINTFLFDPTDPTDPTFVFEPTPHLVSWTIDSLNAEGVNTAFAIGEYFGMSFIEPDLGTFSEEFCRTDCAGGCLGDLNGDDDVDGSDLAIYAAEFANMCP